jgi:hypothetical protein
MDEHHPDIRPPRARLEAIVHRGITVSAVTASPLTWPGPASGAGHGNPAGAVAADLAVSEG